MLSEPLLVIVRLARVFNTLNIPYIVAGSFASSVYGVPRATQDVDLVADVRLEHIDAIVQSLAGEFYVDAAMIQDAVERQTSFNVVHLPSMFKADVFIQKTDDWSIGEMSRALVEPLATPEGPVSIRFASPEDTLLHKLIWYRLGNYVSDRQWSDILGVLRVRWNTLDWIYLRRWSIALEVHDLLSRAMHEGGDDRDAGMSR